MADRVLGLGVQAGVGHGVPLGHEQRVVAEAILTPRRVGEVARHDAQADVFGSVREHRGHGTDETRSAVRFGNVEQLSQQQFVVVRVGGLRAGPAGGAYAGHAVQRIDLETGVVGERREARRGDTGTGLEQRIAGEGALGLGRDRVGRHVGQSEHLDVRSGFGHDPPQLVQLLAVVCGEYDGPWQALGQAQPASAARAARWWSASSAQPASPRASIVSSRPRSNGSPSAVPCTSMNLPSPLITMFMSTSAVTSSL